MRIFLSLIFFLSLSAVACELPPNSKLVIGCTYKCKFPYKFRLQTSAWALGYDVDVVDLREMGPLKVALSRVDGVLIPGGADINPDYYVDKVTPELQSYIRENRGLAKVSEEGTIRDPYEYAFIREYLDHDDNAKLPLLGICRGMQMMTVGQGIPLYLDIKTELGIKNRRYLYDRVHVQKDSLLDDIYQNDSFYGFELHHQGLRVPYFEENAEKYPDVKVIAHSNDGKIAEGIQYLNRPALGIQYHPEKSLTGTAAPVLKWFLTQSCEYKNAKVTK